MIVQASLTWDKIGKEEGLGRSIPAENRTSDTPRFSGNQIIQGETDHPFCFLSSFPQEVR
jgi:hypothetical protein